VRLTYDDFVHFPDDGRRHELIGGSHYVSPSPNTKHQSISGRLHALMWVYLDTHPIGQVFHAPWDVVFGEFDVVEPDLVYISNERAKAIITPAHARGAPDLIVEITSRGTRKRDHFVKRRLYERDGVTEYWIVDPAIEGVQIFRRRDGVSFERPTEIRRDAGDVLVTPLLPGFSLPLERLFRGSAASS
jgi:Uma2 family endonuclease